MGKRKAKSKPPPKKAKAVLPSTFTCLFCNHENAVSVKMDKKAQTGDLWCKICGQSFQTTINALSDPVDVYSDWVDACESVAKEAARGDHSPIENENSARQESRITRDITSGYDDEDVDPEGDFKEEDE